jgi:hypothetical protein
LQDVDPRYDPLANPNYPEPAPWEIHRQTVLDWTHITDYAGSLLVPSIGSSGTLMLYGAAGHSAVNACFWVGFDVASRTWLRVGRRPLPSNMLSGFEAGAVPSPDSFDHTWGDYDGGWSGWPAGFSQPGYNPPEGGHTKGTMFYRPSQAAGNGNGQIFTNWQPNGVNSGNQIRGAHVWDLDSMLPARQGSLRPGPGDNIGCMHYIDSADCIIGWNQVSSLNLSFLDHYDCRTGVWTRRTGISNPPYGQVQSTSFVCGGLVVLVTHSFTANSPLPMRFFALPVAAAVAGLPVAWQELVVDANVWPFKTNNLTTMVTWALCPEDGALYAVNGRSGSQLLYRLTPPAGGDYEKLNGIWSLTSQTMDGEGLNYCEFLYNRLQWSTSLRAFLYVGDTGSGEASPTVTVQAIRPGGL